MTFYLECEKNINPKVCYKEFCSWQAWNIRLLGGNSKTIGLENLQSQTNKVFQVFTYSSYHVPLWKRKRETNRQINRVKQDTAIELISSSKNLIPKAEVQAANNSKGKSRRENRKEVYVMCHMKYPTAAKKQGVWSQTSNTKQDW